MALNNSYGETTKTICLKSQSHKLAHAFDVADGSTVRAFQPVKLNTTGEIVPADSGELARNIIGYAMQNGDAGDVVTVIMKAYLIVFAKPKAAVATGPVAFNGTNTQEAQYMSVTTGAADTEDITGWALDPASAANEEIRVALF